MWSSTWSDTSNRNNTRLNTSECEVAGLVSSAVNIRYEEANHTDSATGVLQVPGSMPQEQCSHTGGHFVAAMKRLRSLAERNAAIGITTPLTRSIANVTPGCNDTGQGMGIRTRRNEGIT